MPSTLGELNLKLPPDAHPRLAALDAWRQTLDDTARVYAREVQQAVRAYLGVVAQFEEGWQLLCQYVLDGRTAEVQSERDRFLHAFEDQLHFLREACDLARSAGRVAQHDLPEQAQLEAEAETLEAKLKKLSSRWQTAEDIEDLVAESIATPAEKLDMVSRKYGYPQAWYDDVCKPF